MNALIWLIDTVVDIAIVLLIAQVILSWLVAFNIANPRHPFVYGVGRFLFQITEPLLRPIRRILPTFGGIDLSPLVLVLIMAAARMFLIRDILPALS